MVTTDELADRFQEDLARLAEEHDVPGVTAAFVHRGQVVEAQHGVINNRTDIPVTADTLSMLQSITKVITATLVMQLVDEGRLDLDATVRSYLPQFRTSDEGRSAKITVRHLLTHTGGFEGDLFRATTPGPDALQRFVDDVVSEARQNTEPGELYSYSNAGFGVLGRLVEVRREMSFEDALRRHIAEPLGVDELAFSADQALAFRTAIGHVRPAKAQPLQPMRVWSPNPSSNPSAGNQLAMSARGLLAFARMHLADGVAPNGNRLLSADTSRVMRQPRFDQPLRCPVPTGQALGWMLDPGGVVQHWGGSFGVTAALKMVPEHDLAAVVLGNAESGSAVINGLLDPLFGGVARVPTKPELPTPAGHERMEHPETIAGRYGTRIANYDVQVEGDGRLMLTTTTENELAAMASLVGVEVPPERREIRPVDESTFVVLGEEGKPQQAITFVGEDGHGRARFLHTGRAAPRLD